MTFVLNMVELWPGYRAFGCRLAGSVGQRAGQVIINKLKMAWS